MILKFCLKPKMRNQILFTILLFCSGVLTAQTQVRSQVEDPFEELIREKKKFSEVKKKKSIRSGCFL
ncbi:hypothetical protein LEP1GSC137_4314 [Leptospira borgpetersenii str. Noumea 25]|uniref:Uncharacterized protein n=1 Tax=Leptospira borgpetersenii str. 200701203 TaxID=1193007 RepID=M3HQ33_LEPBO|nr:hypothetical protein LEP1GSC123_1433 [Leptospira borgpetersenii str. 200701203]EMO09714.1 hypothetical protein LEP1GSC137_4314 [Leptospira borgpetersenii str. Noumea 25]